jgi:hypothetical protein
VSKYPWEFEDQYDEQTWKAVAKQWHKYAADLEKSLRLEHPGLGYIAVEPPKEEEVLR